MNLNKDDGSILKFLTIEPVTTSATTPTYVVRQAVYYEEKESLDDLAYYYVSFTKDNYLHFVKIGAADLKITWHYSLYTATKTYIARNLVMDPMDSA